MKLDSRIFVLQIPFLNLIQNYFTFIFQVLSIDPLTIIPILLFINFIFKSYLHEATFIFLIFL